MLRRDEPPASRRARQGPAGDRDNVRSGARSAGTDAAPNSQRAVAGVLTAIQNADVARRTSHGRRPSRPCRAWPDATMPCATHPWAHDQGG